MGLARRLGERWWLPGAGHLRRDRRAVLVRLPLPRLRSDEAAARTRRSSSQPTATSASWDCRTFRCASRRSASTQSWRTRTQSGSGRRAGSSSGTRCSWIPSRSSSRRSCSPTSSATTRATTSPKGSAGSRSSPCPGAWILMRATRGRGGMGRAGGGAARARRRRRRPARRRAGAELDLPPDGDRGGLGRATS